MSEARSYRFYWSCVTTDYAGVRRGLGAPHLNLPAFDRIRREAEVDSVRALLALLGRDWRQSVAERPTQKDHDHE